MASTPRVTPVRGGVLVAGSMAAMNVVSYLFTLVAARVLGPGQFGAFAAVMALVLVVNVVSLGFQATAARRVAVDEEHLEALEPTLRSAARRAAVILAAVMLALTPVVTTLLQLDSWVTAASLAGAAAALTLVGTDMGILQGAGRWVGFAVVVTSFGAARLVLGTVGILISPTTLGAMLGVVMGLLVPLVMARRVLARGRRPALRLPGLSTPDTSGVLREATHGTHLLFAFFVLSSVDILLARTLLSPHAAGLYAAGLILTKAVLFLPYFVTIIVFPRLARGGSTHLHLWGLAAVLSIGSIVVVATALAPDLVLAFVGGSAYAEVRAELWRFALLGTALAGVQLLVNTALARRHVGAVWWLWAGVVAVGAGAVFVRAATQLLTLVLVVDAVLVVVLVVVTGRDRVLADPSPRP